MPTKQKDIALGLGDYLESFAGQIGAVTYLAWEKSSLTTVDVFENFEAAFYEVILNARNIHFNLEGMGDLKAAYAAGSNGIDNKRLTNWEFFELVLRGRRAPRFAQKLRFYLQGATLTHAQIVCMLEGDKYEISQ